MKKTLLNLIALLCLPLLMHSQVYLDQFENGTINLVTPPAGVTTSEANGEWTLTGDGSSSPYAQTTYGFHNQADGSAATIDVTGNNKIFIKAKASVLGTNLRMDLMDAGGYSTTLDNLTKTLVNDYVIYTYEFSDYQDGGYGGTSCTSGPCPVDGTMITSLQFYIDPQIGGFNGSVVIDYIAVGEEPDEVIMSDVYQDHFDGDSTINFLDQAPGYTSAVNNSNWIISGDGTSTNLYSAMAYQVHNQTTLEDSDIDMTAGENKLYVRMKSSIENTAVRFDAGDINGFITTAGSITNIVGTEYKTYEYNFAGTYQDLGYGGTPCDTSTAPCPVDAARVAFYVIFINPGSAGFAGNVSIEYISVGTPLESNPNTGGVLEYGDHFGNGDAAFIGANNGYTFVEEDSNIKITGDGNAGQYEAIFYNPHDQQAGTPLVVDATGNNKLFFRAKSSAATTQLRVDLVDTANYHTTLASLSKILTPDYADFEIDFSGQYLDAGYGGTACDPMIVTPPCDVDGSAIGTVIMYVNPGTGGFDGEIDMEYISFGAPMGEDLGTYSDHFDNEDRSQITDGGGFTITETGTEMTIVGDGTSGAYTAFSYSLHDQTDNSAVKTDLTSNNKFFVKVKSSVPGTPLRIDLVDEAGFATTEPATLRNIEGEYSILEFDFSNTYSDGGYGGTACTTGPCPVDGTTVSSLLIYIDPNNGGFDGTVTIDWISTLEPLEPITSEPTGLVNYMDEYENDDNSFVTDAAGLTTSEADGNWVITGDGSAGAYGAVSYDAHDQTNSEAIIVDIKGSNNKLFVRAKSTVADLPLRIDLLDNKGYLTTEPAVENIVGTDWSVLEYTYTVYNDGGYGGTACATGPCPVDGERVSSFLFYPDPVNGAFDGDLTIDWISAGAPIISSIVDPTLVNAAKVYPIPAEDELIIEMNLLETGSVSYSIFDFTGKELIREQLADRVSGNYTESISLENLTTGMYVIKVEVNGQHAFTNKIIKK